MTDFGTPVGETPDGVVGVEAEFRSWVKENRPELEDQLMYVDWSASHFIGRDADASGELRMELLEEFMAWRQAKTPIDFVQELAAAMRDDNVDKVNVFLEPDSSFREAVVWSMALKAEPTLSDCTLYGPAGDRVVCDLTFGSHYFYSHVLGETLTTKFGIWVEDGRVWVSDFDFPVGDTPDGIRVAEAEFRSWAESNRPDLDDQIFVGFDEMSDPDHAFLMFPPDHASGEVRMELLDDFMASWQ